MKKKIVFFVAVITITLATIKTGYAYYGKQTNENQTNAIQLSYNQQNPLVQTTTFQSSSSDSGEKPNASSSNNTSSNCCGSGLGSMLDENGNFKDRETYEQELDENVKSGIMSETEKADYLSLYDQCIGVLNNSGSDLESNSSIDDNGSVDDSGAGLSGGSDIGNSSYNQPSCH